MNKINLFLIGFKEGINCFGSQINTVVNTVLLAIVYLLGIGITSLYAKIVKKSFLDKKITKHKETYWSDLNLKQKPIKEYYRQF